MSVIIIPRNHTRPPTSGRLRAADAWLDQGLVYADAGGVGRDAVFGRLPSSHVAQVLPSPVGLARGFGTTSGTSSADRVITGLTHNSVRRTYLLSALINSYNNGRFFEKNTGAGQNEVLYATTGGGVEFSRAWSNIPAWTILGPSTGEWQQLALTYDASSTANDPVYFLNGTRIAATRSIAPTGSLASNSNAYVLGNRGSDYARGFNGLIGHFVVFDSILDDDEIRSLQRNVWQIFQADPVRIYSFPSGPIGISWSSLTASNITQTGARLTLGGIVR